MPRIAGSARRTARRVLAGPLRCPGWRALYDRLRTPHRGNRANPAIRGIRESIRPHSPTAVVHSARSGAAGALLRARAARPPPHKRHNAHAGHTTTGHPARPPTDLGQHKDRSHRKKESRPGPTRPLTCCAPVERVTGVEPASSAWKAEVLPLNHTRMWSGRLDSNQRPSAPKADALPNCATPRSRRNIVNEHAENGKRRAISPESQPFSSKVPPPTLTVEPSWAVTVPVRVLPVTVRPPPLATITLPDTVPAVWPAASVSRPATVPAPEIVLPASASVTCLLAGSIHAAVELCRAATIVLVLSCTVSKALLITTRSVVLAVMVTVSPALAAAMAVVMVLYSVPLTPATPVAASAAAAVVLAPAVVEDPLLASSPTAAVLAPSVCANPA